MARYDPAASAFISEEISRLVHEKGYSLDRAVGAAHTIARRKGYRVPRLRNPHLVVYNPPPTHGLYLPKRGRVPTRRVDAGRIIGQIAADLHAILYEHAEDGAYYEHEFESGAQAFALRNGDILLTRRDGRPLWEDL